MDNDFYRSKTILLVLCGSPSRRGVLEAVAATGIRIVCVHPTIGWASDLVHKWIVAPCDDRPKSVDIVQTYIAESSERFDGILSYDEFGLSLAASLGVALGLPYMHPNVVDCVRDKFCFRQLCQEHNVPSPKCLILDRSLICEPAVCPFGAHPAPDPLSATYDFFQTQDAVEQSISKTLTDNNISFPIVIKPTHGAGKMCTRRADSYREAAEDVCLMHSRISEYIHRWRMTIDEARGMVIEEFLEGGPEVDVDCLVQKVCRVS